MNAFLRQPLTQESDFLAVLSLASIALFVLVPLTMIWNPYVFSQGYGLAVAACAMALMFAFDVPLTLRTNKPEQFLATTVAFYGLRLSLFLFYREITVRNMRDQTKAFHNKYAASKLLVLTSVLSLLYAGMVSPLLYALKRPPTEGRAVLMAWAGTTLSFFGVLIESIADQHKCTVKRQHGVSYGEKIFVGPTSWLYAFCRHPNFCGEVFFWTGLFMAGLPCYNKSWTAWISSSAGWICLVKIMQSSSSRLDKKQHEWYHDQPRYEAWKRHVTSSMIPFLPHSCSYGLEKDSGIHGT